MELCGNPPLSNDQHVDFIAIDFETATSDPNSACAVGLTFVVGLEVTATAHRLIQPPGNQYDQGNINVHGIYPEDTELSPDFLTVWRELHPMLAGKALIAHNARFDMSVIKASWPPTGTLMSINTPTSNTSTASPWPGTWSPAGKTWPPAPPPWGRPAPPPQRRVRRRGLRPDCHRLHQGHPLPEPGGVLLLPAPSASRSSATWSSRPGLPPPKARRAPRYRATIHTKDIQPQVSFFLTKTTPSTKNPWSLPGSFPSTGRRPCSGR